MAHHTKLDEAMSKWKRSARKEIRAKEKAQMAKYFKSGNPDEFAELPDYTVDAADSPRDLW